MSGRAPHHRSNNRATPEAGNTSSTGDHAPTPVPPGAQTDAAFWTAVFAAFDYCPDSGVLTWKEQPRESFASAGAWKRTNKRFAGKPAFSGPTKRGYCRGMFRGKWVVAHRIAWAIHHQMAMPDEMAIDHINGVRNDNRIVNLRAVSHALNMRNMKIGKKNKSGCVGVRRERKTRWRAAIRHDGRNIHLGCFDTKEEAIAVRRAAEREFGYHPNHGLTAEERKETVPTYSNGHEPDGPALINSLGGASFQPVNDVHNVIHSRQFAE